MEMIFLKKGIAVMALTLVCATLSAHPRHHKFHHKQGCKTVIIKKRKAPAKKTVVIVKHCKHPHRSNRI